MADTSKRRNSDAYQISVNDGGEWVRIPKGADPNGPLAELCFEIDLEVSENMAQARRAFRESGVDLKNLEVEPPPLSHRRGSFTWPLDAYLWPLRPWGDSTRRCPIDCEWVEVFRAWLPEYEPCRDTGGRRLPGDMRSEWRPWNGPPLAPDWDAVRRVLLGPPFGTTGQGFTPVEINSFTIEDVVFYLDQAAKSDAIQDPSPPVVGVTERVRSGRKEEPHRHAVNWARWAIALSDSGWYVFQRFANKKQFCDRGRIDLPDGTVATFAKELALSGGVLCKVDAIKLFRKDGWTDDRIFRSRCQTARRGLVARIRKQIIAIAGGKEIPDNPIPWNQKCDRWEAVVKFGYVVGDEGSRRTFRTVDGLDRDDLLDSE